jgi:hypothetical protein
VHLHKEDLQTSQTVSSQIQSHNVTPSPSKHNSFNTVLHSSSDIYTNSVTTVKDVENNEYVETLKTDSITIR